MASLDFLTAATYEAPSPVQAPRRRRSLNTIMEDDEESMRGGDDREDDRGRRGSLSPKAPSWSDWRSPLSDHFPTPRGNHFMIAPLMPASPSSPADSEYSQTSSGPWTRDSVGTQATDFDDLYDVSSDEEDSYKARQARSSIVRETSSRKSTASPRQRNSLPSLIIPQSNEQWKAMAAFKKLASPVPPTPPPKVPMSPAVFQYLAEQSALAVPSSSAPPSLDGSLTSEQMALMSAPPTPNTGNEESDDVDQWGGVQLQPAAMATLQAFALDDMYDIPEQVIELPIRSPTTEMQQSPPPINTSIHRNNSVVLSPEQQQSMNSLTAIEIPSPGGFFASLSNVSRHTWHIMPSSLNNEAPPSSATAEHFYKTPWMSEPIERIVEETESMSDGCPTARPILLKTDSEETIKGLDSPIEEIIATEIISDYDVTYVRKLNEDSLEHFDRTQLWLTAQTSYLSALINPTEARDDEVAIQRRDSQIVRGGKATVDSDSETASKKKTVRFSEVPTSVLGVSIVVGRPLPQLTRLESAYFRSFRTFVAMSRYRDTFVHRTPRFEALQIQRTNFPEAYRNQLLGKFQLSVVPMSAKKRMSSNVARGDETAPEDPAKLKADKEREAKEQMSAATWNVTAMKMLNGGRLIAAPVAKRLARLSRMGPSANGDHHRDRARVLDLGEQATCDWAWHCATEYPNTKVYTVTTKTSRQLSNSNIHGPANHRQVTVNKLTSLPFKDDQFDLISARNLAHILKACSENGEDEYDARLAEGMRILKPGGYLEFNMLDSDIMNAGPLGQAKSVEFGFSLKTRGDGATPTQAWLGRLARAGFVGVKRAWMVLPMGAPTPVADRTAAAASITGLVGGWAWEKWMLKLQMEIGVAEENLLEGVGEIVEE
ncbi:hypothetical protein VE04_02207, partial [Pseudogymnoascus sp. 24MN13]